MKETEIKSSKIKKSPKAKKNNSDNEIIALRDFIEKELDGDKALDIVSISLKDKTSIADFMFIATGTSSRHITRLAENLREKVKAEFGINSIIEGEDSGDWVILDSGDIIVHLFRQEVREFYNLEKLWGSDFSTVDYTRYKP